METGKQSTQLLEEIEMNDINNMEPSIAQSLNRLENLRAYWSNIKEQKSTCKTFYSLIFIMVLAIFILVIILFIKHQNYINSRNHCNKTFNICHYEPSSFISSSTANTSNTTTTDDTINNIQISQRPKNLILMIGDGMGTIYNSAFRLYKNQDRTILDSIFKGRYSTNPSNNTITDSAAGATAFSSGTKTFNGNIAVDVSGNPLGTILEALKRKGKGTALIATKSITDATPASFASHVLNRNFQNLIAKQLATLQQHYPWTNCTIIDILMGGGKQYFDAWGFNENTYHSYGWNKLLTNNDTLYTLCAQDVPVIGVFANNHMPFYLDILNTEDNNDPVLLDMSKVSLELLNKTYYTEGFFIMIEGSSIDACGHRNDIACIMSEMEQFYDTVEYVTKWAEIDGDTLVVVLADHQTGGLSIGRQDSFVKSEFGDGKTHRVYGFTEQEIIEYYGDYMVNPLIVSRDDDASGVLSYKWRHEWIANISHTSKWFNDTLTARSDGNDTMDIMETLALIEEHWFILSEKEKAFLNFTFVNGGILEQALVHIINVRTGTGFTTHGHTAVDVSLYAMGVASDLFFGHWINDEIGQLLSAIMDCADEQNQQTLLLQELFVNGTLELCDAKNKPPIIEWNNSVPYPWGNLKYPQNCVDYWQ